MGIKVAFDYTAWTLRYPELAAAVNQPLAEAYFAEAALYHDNNGGMGPSDTAVQSVLMNMVTAHIAALNMPGSSPLVGHITNAAEGSVNVQVQNDQPPGTPQWWQSSKYGAAYWAATVSWRTIMYVPGPQRQFDVPPIGQGDPNYFDRW